jgi:hypothetical protein
VVTKVTVNAVCRQGNLHQVASNSPKSNAAMTGFNRHKGRMELAQSNRRRDSNHHKAVPAIPAVAAAPAVLTLGNPACGDCLLRR